ncbi:hypothetical protein [Chitinophaga sp. Cy-1792]|uniref:hypothetical protein n=1 Tax=Chitinophaga sp. Cy-1792 TaxID=2608339 RepID=UPI001423260B|nr:hypothetical protein [Chitinophaga sp. Cy-1792]NIG56063.1 hypothetical protein [Chitinophaga sp. Cy-1792]
MPIRNYAAFLLLLFVACQPSKKKETGNVVSTENFGTFVQNLTLLHTPTPNLAIWDTVTAQYMYRDSSVKFQSIHAVRIPSPDNFIAVLYNGVTDESHMDTYFLASYTKDGKLIQKTKVYEMDNDRMGEQNTYSKLVMGSDSIIEVREYYINREGGGNKASLIKHLLIQQDGHHSWQKAHKETFLAFAGNFPVLNLPVSYPETPKSTGFPQFDLNNGWYDPSELLGYDFPKFYKVGKYNIPGSAYTLYLVKSAEVMMEGGEEDVEDGLYVAVFDGNGREIDRHQVTGGEGGEGIYLYRNDFSIDSAGTMHMVEKSNDGSEFGFTLGVGTYTTNLNKDIAVQPNGTLAITATAFDMDLKDFVGDSARYNTGVADTTSEDNQYCYLGNYPGANIHIVMHGWFDKKEFVYEILSLDQNRKILDALTVASKLSAGSKPDLHVPIDADILYMPPVARMKMNGVVRVLLKDGAITVGADGKLTKTAAAIADATATK